MDCHHAQKSFLSAYTDHIKPQDLHKHLDYRGNHHKCKSMKMHKDSEEKDSAEENETLFLKHSNWNLDFKMEFFRFLIHNLLYFCIQYINEETKHQIHKI